MSIYTDNTFYTQTKIQMINTCLLAIGEVVLPEGTLIEDLPIGTDARTAEFYVVKAMKKVQNMGWYFNTDINFKFTPDSDGFISVPANLLRIDPGREPTTRGKIIKKGARLYDLDKQTYKFEDSILLDAVWLVDYSELSVAAFEYISLKAARTFQQSVIGSVELAGFTQQDELEALTEINREHMQYRDHSMLERPASRLVNPSGIMGRSV
jgi:hypothetical protein